MFEWALREQKCFRPTVAIWCSYVRLTRCRALCSLDASNRLLSSPSPGIKKSSAACCWSDWLSMLESELAPELQVPAQPRLCKTGIMDYELNLLLGPGWRCRVSKPCHWGDKLPSIWRHICLSLYSHIESSRRWRSESCEHWKEWLMRLWEIGSGWM